MVKKIITNSLRIKKFINKGKIEIAKIDDIENL